MGPDTAVWEEGMGQAWAWVWAEWALWALLVSCQAHALQPVSMLVCTLSVHGILQIC